MNKIIMIAGLLAITLSCVKKEEKDSNETSSPAAATPCGYHNGYQLHRGPQGGCYYINSNGNKVYVGHEECNC